MHDVGGHELPGVGEAEEQRHGAEQQRREHGQRRAPPSPQRQRQRQARRVQLHVGRQVPAGQGVNVSDKRCSAQVPKTIGKQVALHDIV